MKLTIEPTDQMADVDGTPCRLWSGRTQNGSRCYVFVAALAVNSTDSETLAEAERELIERDVVVVSGEEPPP